MRPILLACLSVLAACSPTLDWREVRFDTFPILAMMPCKPDRGIRTVAWGSVPTEIHMAGCETGGATFAVMVARLADPGSVGTALDSWKAATLTHMKARDVRESAFTPPGSLVLPQSVRVAASGQGPAGQRVNAQAVWLARPEPGGLMLIHAVLYSDTPRPDIADSFLGSLRLP